MKINIFGSTGIIGKKTLNIIKYTNKEIIVNLLCAKSNYNLLKKQIEFFKPNYVFIDDKEKSKKLKSQINKKTKVLNFIELSNYLKSSTSDFSVLAISGYKSLYFLDDIVNNTKNLGIASKEAVVSAGHIFKKRKYFKKTNIFPLDSEHFSLHELFSKKYIKNNLKNIILTASGGPFYKRNFNQLKNVSFQEAINHPKWKMGYKNSIDSATLVNKCLELIEAHYLFDIPYEKLKILIHPEALVHSIVVNYNFTSHMNLFKNDMSIPIINFILNKDQQSIKSYKNLNLLKFSNLNFLDVQKSIFPIYYFFNKLDKSNPENLIKFNIGNEFAVNLFKNNHIKYTEIFQIIKKVTSLNLNSDLNNIKQIIKYHEKIEIYLQNNFNYNL